LCRYDYVILAVRALQDYANQCAEHVDTVEYLNRVNAAVTHLRALESRIADDAIEQGATLSTRSPSAEITVQTAIKELERMCKKFKPQISAAKAFLETHAAGIAEIRTVDKSIRGVENVLEAGLRLRSAARLMQKKGKESCEI